MATFGAEALVDSGPYGVDGGGVNQLEQLTSHGMSTRHHDGSRRDHYQQMLVE